MVENEQYLDQQIIQNGSIGARSSVIACSDLVVRYISLSDTYRLFRDAWVARTFINLTVFELSNDGVGGLARYPEGYDVLIIGGNDIGRLSKFLKANRSLLTGVVKICVTNGAGSHDMARALLAGFDDVLDLNRMHAEEAIARVTATYRRYQLSSGQSKESA